MIVSVGDQDSEDDAAKQGMQIFTRRGTPSPERVRHLKVTSGLMILRTEHAHGGKKRNSFRTVTVEPGQEQDFFPSHRLKRP